MRRAGLGNPDEFAGLAPLADERIDAAALRLFDPEIARLDSKTKIALALETERAALRDKRITNSYGATFATNEIRSVLVLSNGFVGEYEQTYCGLGVGLQAGDTDHRVEDSWSSSKRHFKDLERPEEIARKAVERTVRQLGPRKIRTQTVPVIFEPTQTAWLMGFLFGCVTGTAVYQKSTFLAGRLGRADRQRADHGRRRRAAARRAGLAPVRLGRPAVAPDGRRRPGRPQELSLQYLRRRASSAWSRRGAPTAAGSARPTSSSSRGTSRRRTSSPGSRKGSSSSGRSATA